MNPARTLPAGFERLEPFVGYWAADSAAGRDRLRTESSEADRAAFYAVAKDLLAPALANLDRKPLAGLDASEQRLMNLMLCFAHVAVAVEFQGAAEDRHAEYRRHLRIARASADL